MNLARRWIVLAACPALCVAGLFGKDVEAAKSSPAATEPVYAAGGPLGANMQILLGTTSIQIDGGFATQVYSVRPGTHLTLTLNSATPILSAVWSKNGSQLAATTPTIEIASATAADSGFYRADFTTSPASSLYAIPVYIRVEEPLGQRTLNLSTRATVSPAAPFFISGFVVSPQAGDTKELKYMLIRAVGPTLANYGVPNVLADPVIKVFAADGTEIPAPVGTGPATAFVTAQVGAFPLPAGSKDLSALYALPQGSYSVRVSSASGATGTVLLELYDVPSSGF